jgi:hypothetical protein
VNRVLVWGVAAACLCYPAVKNLAVSLGEYRVLRDDTARQLNLISELESGQSQRAQELTILSSAETVNQFSSLAAGFELVEQSMVSEKNADVLDGWEEWRVSALCTGSLGGIYAFINSLENESAYHALNFTIGANSAGQYDLNIGLCFYAPNE